STVTIYFAGRGIKKYPPQKKIFIAFNYGIMFAYTAHIETTLPHTDYKALYEQSLLQIQSLQLQLTELKKMIFGSKGEKFIASSNTSAVQPDLFPDDKLGEHTVIKTTLIKSFEKKQTSLAVKHPGQIGRATSELQSRENIVCRLLLEKNI